MLESLPDEELMCTLEKARGHGRDDFPIRAMWNMQIAKTIFGHDTQESIIHELNRNVQLRHMCGFYGERVPQGYNVSRFLDLLAEYQDEVDAIFTKLTEILSENLDDFGKNTALDSKCTFFIRSMGGKAAFQHPFAAGRVDFN